MRLTYLERQSMEQLEKKTYSQDCSPEDSELLKKMVFMHHEKIIYWNEAPVMSLWQIKKYEEKAHELIKEHDLKEFSILVDLRDTSPPNSELREALRNFFIPLKEIGLIKVCAFTEKNFFINAAAKFVLGGSGLTFKVFTKQEDAEKELLGDFIERS